MQKINIDPRYIPEEEIRKDERPYIDYVDCLEATFNMNEIDGFCDLGCASGVVMKYIKIRYPNQRIYGIEYFPWQKEEADFLIQNYIDIHDLRDSLIHFQKYDIVNCTEVCEHIEAQFVPTLIQNIKSLSNKYVILSWSEGGGINHPENDPHCQHLNPVNYEDYVSLIESYGFVRNKELTLKFLTASLNKNHFYYWWRDSLIVWEVL